jgi:hypothetical protein
MSAKMEKKETTQEFLDRLELETKDVIVTDEEFKNVEDYIDELIETDDNSKGKIDIFGVAIAIPICVLIACSIAILALILAIRNAIMAVVYQIKESTIALFFSLRR